ncbi:MAG TPA: TonB-dependent receptor [Acidobacteriaceae bacterium]|jgi:outer membrane receptor protein involved in Fe transport|nr:TonB-dependent receptor [Acidobacteriaceae bacterium]
MKSLQLSGIRGWVAVAVVTLALLAGSHFAVGQGITTGGIAGTVVDPAGAVIGNATVTATSLETNIQNVQHSRADGAFTLVNLPPGDYTLKIEASGFEALRIEKVTVAVGQTTIGPQMMKIGAASTIQVEGDVTPLISTTQSQVSSTIDTAQLQSLPFGGGFDTAALLTPGVVITHDNSFSNNNGAYGGFSSQGERGRSNNFEIDGQSNNDNSVAGPQVFFSNPDAISSIEVITNNFSAQYGRNAGSVVNYITKAGSNSFHGTAFEWYEGNWGESFAQGQKSAYQGYCPQGEKNNCLNVATSPLYGEPVPSLPRYVDNWFGGSFGGPILRDRLFFFSSWNFNRYRNGGGTSLSGSSITPTPDGLTALASAFPNEPGVAALVNNGPYSVKGGNPHPSGPIYSIPVTIGETTTDIPFSSIARSVPSLSNDEELMGRLDYQATQKDHFFLRYFYQDDPYFNAGGSVVAGAWYNVPDTAHSVGADWEHTLSANWVNQLRYSFQQTSVLFQGGGQPSCVATTPDQCTTSIGFGGKLTDTTGDQFSMLGYGYPTNIPQGRVVKVTQAQDNVTWTHGRQTVLFGGEYDYQNSPNPFLPDYSGGFNFSDITAANNPVMTDFLTGTGSLTLGNGPFTSKFTENDFAFYFQDDWKVMPNLTLNLGVRYEFFGQAVNLLHNETVTRESNPQTAFWDQSLPLSVRTFPYTNPDYHNVQPRIGFAYTPVGMARKLVVRGGFAINFDPAFYNIFLNSASAAPVVNLGTVTDCGTTVQCLPTSGASGAQVRAQSLPLLPTGPGINPGFRNTTYNSPNFHNPYTESYLFGFEYGLGNHAAIDVKYVGNHQVGNFQSTDGNPYLLPLQGTFPGAVPITLCTDATAPGYGRPDCTHANVRTRTNGAFALYNSLQMRLTTRNYHGLTTELNWTYSKTIDNASEIFSTFAGGNTNAFAQNPLNPNEPERAVSGISLTHDISSGFTYALPIFPSQSHWYGKSIGGWKLNGIYTFNTGQPGTPLQYGFFGDGPDYQSYTADVPFMDWQISGYDVARAVLSNPKAPASSVGIYDPDGGVCGGPAGYYSWADCSPVSPSSVKWLRNTQALGTQMGAKTPYFGSGRNLVRSAPWNNMDASLFKSFPVTERVTAQLQLIAYNVFNRQYLGMPDLGLDDVSSDPHFTTFENPKWSYGSNRNTQIGLKFLF